MKIALLLHIYQPSTQFSDMLEIMVKKSYGPLFSLLLKYPRTHFTLNICASLTEQLKSLGYEEILEMIRDLGKRGIVEFTGSAKYHPLLPKIPFTQILRQIHLNEETNRLLLGEVWKPRGFFPPEMAYSREIGEALKMAKYDWVLLDESAHSGAMVQTQAKVRKEEIIHENIKISSAIFSLMDEKLKIIFRDREASTKIAFAKIKDLDQFLGSLPASMYSQPERYLALAMDGETFGYHRPRALEFLEELLKRNQQISSVKTASGVQLDYGYHLVTLSEVVDAGYPQIVLEPRDSTWGRTDEEEKKGRLFPRWDNHENVIHQMQWALLSLAVDAVQSYPTPQAQQFLDQGLQSDQFWWASHNPCWHPPMIEKGAKLLFQATENSQSPEEEKRAVRNLYEKIVRHSIELFGDQIIAC